MKKGQVTKIVAPENYWADGTTDATTVVQVASGYVDRSHVAVLML